MGDVEQVITGATRRQIIDAAVRLIAERGFAATSVEEIAEAAGVAKGSVYYNFGSKGVLFAAILTEGVNRLTVGLREALGHRQGVAPLQVLVTELLRQVREHPDFTRVLAAEVFRTGRDWQASIRLVHDEAMAVFTDAVRFTDPTVGARDAAVMGSAVFGATLVAGLEWLAFQPERELDDVLAAILRTVALGRT
jgi:AcrR family transcriptional regulator